MRDMKGEVAELGGIESFEHTALKKGQFMAELQQGSDKECVSDRFTAALGDKMASAGEPWRTGFLWQNARGLTESVKAASEAAARG